MVAKGVLRERKPVQSDGDNRRGTPGGNPGGSEPGASSGGNPGGTPGGTNGGTLHTITGPGPGEGDGPPGPEFISPGEQAREQPVRRSHKRGRGKRGPDRQARNYAPKAVQSDLSKPINIKKSLEGIEGILLSLHTIAAQVAQIPELELAESEAKKLADGIARVAVLYDMGASEKALAWANLALCAGGIYGTRVFAYNLRKKSEEHSKRVLPFVQQQPQTQTQAQSASVVAAG